MMGSVRVGGEVCSLLFGLFFFDLCSPASAVVLFFCSLLFVFALFCFVCATFDAWPLKISCT